MPANLYPLRKLLQRLRSRFSLYLLFIYAFILRLLRFFHLLPIQDSSILILPPESPGSLGDEAVETAVIQALTHHKPQVIRIISYSSTDNWSHLPLVNETTDLSAFFRRGSWKTIEKFMRVVSTCSKFYILGTDVLDGAYSEEASYQRLLLARLAAYIGVDTSIIGFSFKLETSKSTINAFRNLPLSVRLCLRDRFSNERLSYYLNRSLILASDPAFLLKPDYSTQLVHLLADWANDQRDDGRLLIGLNLNHQLLKIVPALTVEQLVQCYSDFAEIVFAQDEKISFVLIPHDSRGEVNEHVLSKLLFEKMPNHIKPFCFLISDLCRASEIKAICGHLDIALSGRMHCAIACLGQGVPVACLRYQDKFEGLFHHFGIDHMTISPIQALEPDKLYEFFWPIFKNRIAIQEQVKSRLPQVIQLAEVNFYDKHKFHSI